MSPTPVPRSSSSRTSVPGRWPKCGAPCCTRSRGQPSNASTSGAAPTGGSRSHGARKIPCCRHFLIESRTPPEPGVDSPYPPYARFLEERSTLTKRRLALAAILFVTAAAALALAFGTSPGSAKQAAPFKAAWIYVGPHNDGGWSQAHDEGRQAVQNALGSKVATTYKENVPEGPQVAQVIESLIRDGNKIIFATSFGFQDAMFAAAAKHPDVKFEMATGTKMSKNMAEYYGAGEDAIYLSGIAAGAATKKGTVGYVVPFAIPEVIRHTNAFALGVRKSHPGAKVRIIWTNSWFAPDKEKKAAESLHSAGADVLGQNVDSPSAGQYSESAGIPWVGYDSNAQKFAKNSWLTAAVYNWGPYYTKRVK